MVLSRLRCCSSQVCEGSGCRDAEKAGRCGGGWREGGKGRGHGLCSREAMAAVFGEGRVKVQEDVLLWEEIGKEVLCVVCLTVAVG